MLMFRISKQSRIFLLFGKRDFVNQLLAVDGLDFHEYTIGLVAAFELADGKGLTPLGRTLMNDAEFARRMLFKEVAKYKFSLRLAIGLHVSVQCNVDCLIQVPRQLFRATSFDGLLYVVDDVALGKCWKALKTRKYKK